MAVTACPECNGKVSSEAPSCPHCGYVQKPAGAPTPQAAAHASPASAVPAPASPTETSAVPSFIDPKKNLRALVRLLVLGAVGICLIVGWFVFKAVMGASSGRSTSSNPFSSVLGPRVLIDQSSQITDSNFLGIPFRLEQPSKITLEASITQGQKFTLYVLTENEWETNLGKNKPFMQIEALGAERKSRHQAVGNLGPGNWRIAIKEGSDPNILGGPDVAMVHLKVIAE